MTLFEQISFFSPSNILVEKIVSIAEVAETRLLQQQIKFRNRNLFDWEYPDLVSFPIPTSAPPENAICHVNKYFFSSIFH